MKRQIKGLIEQLASRFGPHRFGSGEPRLWVLMYHRILPAHDPRFALEEPGMMVTPDTFRQQLRILKELFEILPLAEWIARRDTGKPLPARACAITFDDGWLDNYEHAFPILQQERVPATLFAVADMIGTSRQFWPNRLVRLLTNIPASHRIEWLEKLGYTPNQAVDGNTMAQLILNCKTLSDHTLHLLLDEADLALNLSSSEAPALMNWEQLQTMQRSGLVEIGSHTCNHYRFTDNLPADLIETEIRNSKTYLEERLGCTVSSFCYPNGIASPEAVRLVSKIYQSAVTTDRGVNDLKTSPFKLKRVLVHEDVSNTPTKLGARLSGWL